MGAGTARNTTGTIDVDEVYPEEIPAELLERVADNHPNLAEVQLQVRRGRWQTMKRGHRRFASQPPEVGVHDICVHLVKTATLDAEENGEGFRYRARLRCRNGEHEYSRFATVRGVITDDGAFAIVDDSGAGSDDDPMRALLESNRQATETSFRAMEMVLKLTNGYATVGDTFQKLLFSAAEVFAKNVNGQVEVLKVQMEMEQNAAQHKEKMAKMEKGFSMLEGPVGKIGDEIVEHLLGGLRNKKPGGSTRTNGRPRPSARKQSEPVRCGYAQTLEDIFSGLPDDKRQQAEEYMSADEWKLINAARKAATDDIFDGIFTRFYSELCTRGDKGTTEWVQRMSEIIGQDNLRSIGMLIQRVEKARAAQQDASPS